MRQRRLKLFIIPLLVLSLGLHWAVLQTVAWTGMFLNFVADTSISEAVVKTFNGENPCDLCLIIKESKQQSQDDAAMLAKLKFEGVVDEKAVRLFPPGETYELTQVSRTWSARSPAPPKPPPRNA